MTIQAVLFDLGNTLVGYYHGAEFRPILRHCLERSASVLGSTVTEELYERALELNREDPSLEVRPLVDRLRSLFALGDDDETTELCREFMGPIFACARLDPEAHLVLDELRRRGVKTAIVSNTPWGSPAEPWRAELERHRLLHRVDAAVFCVEAGFRKPHPAPFELALSRLRVLPEEAIFVGDDARWDIEGAKRARIKAVLLHREELERSDCVVIRELRAVLGLVEMLPR